jgi:hypothetical protein
MVATFGRLILRNASPIQFRRSGSFAARFTNEGSVRKIAEHIGAEPTEAQWPSILEYTSFPWMKAHESLFEGSTLGGQVPVLKRGAMIRKGETGNAKADGMTDEISQHLREVGGQIFPDRDALDWLYSGGKLP